MTESAVASSVGKLSPAPGKGLAGTLRYLPLLILALAWEAVSLSGTLPPDSLPPIHSVIMRAVEFFSTGDILPHFVRSIERASIGFAIAVALGILLGTAMAKSLVARGLIKPIIALTNPLPKPAFYPLFLIWLGAGNWSTIAVVFTGCVIPVVISTFNGVNRVNPHVVWMARNLGMSGSRLVFRIILRAALPEILLGVRISLTLSWVMLVSAEMLAGQDGLGFLIFFVGEGGDYQGMFSVVLIIGLIGFITDRLFCRIMDRLLVPYRG